MLKILNYDGTEEIEIEKSLSQHDLKKTLVNEWTPYFDCFKCGRKSYCKYSENRTGTDYLYNEVQCGVVKSFIEEYIDISATEFETLSETSKNEFLLGLYYLSKFVFDSENYVGAFQQRGFINEMYTEQVANGLLGLATDIRISLQRACEHLKQVDFTRAQRLMILVEGASEKEFIEQYSKLELGFIGSVYVESYDGKDNRDKKKIFQLINHFKSKGFKVLMQIDKDGKDINLNQHVQSGLFDHNDYFAFSEDLENTYPNELIAECLEEFGSNSEAVLERLSTTRASGVTLYTHLKEIVEWLPPKPLFAKKMANLVSQYDLVNRGDCEHLELVKFLKFISEHSLKI
ncbi:hypothetical protein [Photobacterium leiognathi]|uniref:hypothetical protein n=1 Tax=Photobacterium leiognathi TaxID=553611 RepID=UPI002980EE52|nr:hypothetical protein [Photobacterium leiognathi]